MANTNDAEQAALQQQINEEMQKFGRVLPDTQARLMDAQTGIKNFSFKVDVATKTVGKLGDAVANTAKAMYNGEKGAAAFNKTVDDLADAAQIAATGLALLVPGGPLIKAAVAGITYLATSALKAGAELTKTANSQSDALYTAFQKMSVSGASASDGMTGVFNNLQNLGLGIQDLDGYVTLINNSSKDLALFGGTVFKGRQAFAEMNKEMAPFTEQLYNAGLSQQDIAKGAMSYLKIQTQLGASQTMTSKQLAEGARKYLVEQDALTKLTGMNRADAEAAREAAMSEQRFAAKIAAMRASGDPKQIAAAEELIKANAILESQSKEAAQGFRDLTTGMVTTEASQKALIGSNGEALAQATNIADGNATAIQGVQAMGTAFGEFAKDMNATAQAGVFEDFSIKFADSVKLGIFASKDLEAEYKKINADLVAQGVTGKKAQDELQQTQTDIRLAQKEAMLATQELVQLAVPAATNAMLKLAEAAAAAATALLATANAKPANDALKEQATQSVYSNNEAVGAAGEVGQIAAEGQIAAAGNQPAPEKIKSVKDMSFLDKLLVGEENVKKRQAAEAAGQTPAQAAAATTADPTRTTAKMLSNVIAPGATAAVSAIGAPAAPAAPGVGAAPAQGSVQTGDSVRIGNEIRKGGTVSWRTNNPGNGSYSGITKQYGAIGAWKNPKGDEQQRTSGIAIFPTLEDGEKYKIAQWLRPMYKGLTIDAGAMQWAEAAKKQGPGSAYARGLAKAAGAQLDTVVGTLTDTQLKAMTRYQTQLEGFREGQVVQAEKGGVFDGPKSGYAATLHGPEAVIPLKDGAVPVSMSQEFNMTATNLGELVNQMRSNMAVQASMLAVMEDIRRSQSDTADNTSRMAAYASN
jgi:hypothetical protein